MMLISAGIDAGTSAYRNIKSKKGLAELDKQRLPQYMDAAAGLQENKKMYGDMAKSGMGPGSLNLAKSTFAAGQSALTAAPAGGQLRTQIGRLAGANAGGFANSLAAQNEGIRRQGMSGVAQANLGLSELQQRDIGVGLQRRFKAEEEYGQAIQDSRRQFMGAVSGVASGFMDYKNLQEDRALTRDYYGLNDNSTMENLPGNAPGNAPSVLGKPGTFPLSSPAGPQTRNQQSLAQSNQNYGPAPSGTVNTSNSSLNPNVSGAMYDTPFSAPDGTNFQKFATPNLMNQISTQGIKASPFGGAPMAPAYPISPSGNIAMPNAPNYNFGDMSGDPSYQRQNNSVLNFRNPYNINRGFMDTYDATAGPYGQIQFKQR